MTDTWTWATVTQASPLRIKVDGDTSALDATTGDLVGLLAVDDRVRVHLHSDGIIVTGIQGGAGGGTLPAPQRSAYSTVVIGITSASFAALPSGGPADIVLTGVPQRMLVLVSIYGWLQVTAAGTNLRAQVVASGATSDTPDWNRRLQTGSYAASYRSVNLTYYVEVEVGATTFQIQAYRDGSGTANYNYGGFEITPVRWL